MNSENPAAELYLDLLERCLTDTLRPELFRPLDPAAGGLIQSAKRATTRVLDTMLRPTPFAFVRRESDDPAVRHEGMDWPARAETMIGRKRLSQLRNCIRRVLAEDVPGDLIECGVWRGGATIFMRAMLKAYSDSRRRVWVADSFKGLPPSDCVRYPADAENDFCGKWQRIVI